MIEKKLSICNCN